LAAGLYREKAARSINPIVIKVLIIVLLLGAAGFAMRYVDFPSFGGRDANLGLACLAVVEALRTGNIDPAMPFFADVEPGLTRLREEDLKLAKAKTVQAATPDVADAARISCADFLRDARKTMESNSVSFDQVKALAIVGAQAKVTDRQRMRKGADILAGELYFAAGGKIYALELSARKCGKNYFILDFWACNPIEATPENIAAYADQKFREFRQQSDATSGPVQIGGAKKIYIAL
jgi:hypothetical protein